MRIDRVKYTAHYDEFGVLKDQWIGLEGQIDDTEVPEKKLDEIKEITEQWYRKQNPNLNPYNLPQQEPTWIRPTIIQSKPEDKETGVTPDLILASKDLTELESYRWHLKKNNELERAYMVRHDQLSGK